MKYTYNHSYEENRYFSYVARVVLKKYFYNGDLNIFLPEVEEKKLSL